MSAHRIRQLMHAIEHDAIRRFLDAARRHFQAPVS